ncbi:mRNA-binding protein nab2 [Microbotryomycetes sp. JL221]|nr:mRNA-binding protein nab2 [Microbotryomycetes sp. JL221]
MADVVPGTPQAQKLQDAIQKQLAFLGWSTEDDNVMAEYVLVMIGNRKTPEQISTELSDLIGGDFDQSFVTWLFDEVDKHYPQPKSVPQEAESAEQHDESPRRQSNGGPGRLNVFGAAVSGVKRDARDLDGQSQTPNQRPRRDGPPSGPRGMTNTYRDGNGGGKSLLDRMGPRPGRQNNHNNGRMPGPPMGMPPQAYDMIAQAINAVRNGAHPSALAGIPFPALASHPMVGSLPPGVIQQAQAAAMAQAQAFAAMQNAWSMPLNSQNRPNGPPPGMGPPAFNPSVAPFQPGGSPGPAHGRQGPRPGGPGPGSRTANGPSRSSSVAPHHATQPAPVVLPTKPTDEAICTFGVKCTKPQCQYSHPSPVATEESGLVLSSEVCPKQLDCDDKDCPKSHVSPAQKAESTKEKISINAKGETTFVPPPKASAPPVTDPMAIPGAGERPCKFGGACTRPDCVFLHPWDTRGDPANAGNKIPCRFGANCTRPDCHYGHPPNRPLPYSKNFGKPVHDASKYSATFNKASATKPKDQIGDWPKQDSTHVSERLKRFAKEGDGNGDVEKIIPGETETKLEIDVEDDATSPRKAGEVV